MVLLLIDRNDGITVPARLVQLHLRHTLGRRRSTMVLEYEHAPRCDNACASDAFDDGERARIVIRGIGED